MTQAQPTQASQGGVDPRYTPPPAHTTSGSPNPIVAGQELFAHHWNRAAKMLGEHGSGYDAVAQQRRSFDTKFDAKTKKEKSERVRRATFMVGVEMLTSIARQIGRDVTIGESLPRLRPVTPGGEGWDYVWVGEADEVEPGVILRNLGEPYCDSILEHTREIKDVGVLNEAWTWGEAIDNYRRKVQAAKEEEEQAEREAATAAFRRSILEGVLSEFDDTGRVDPFGGQAGYPNAATATRIQRLKSDGQYVAGEAAELLHTKCARNLKEAFTTLDLEVKQVDPGAELYYATYDRLYDALRRTYHASVKEMTARGRKAVGL